jgi:hypothetical protein
MLDITVTVPRRLGIALLRRLDRALAILEYHFPVPEAILARKPRRKPREDAHFSAPDDFLGQMELARDHRIDRGAADILTADDGALAEWAELYERGDFHDARRDPL